MTTYKVIYFNAVNGVIVCRNFETVEEARAFGATLGTLWHITVSYQSSQTVTLVSNT